MNLPTFNLDEVLSDRAKHIGELPWLGVQPIPIQTVAPQQGEAGRAIVVTGGAHGVKAGDRVFVAGYGPTIDHFYVAAEHPEARHRKNAFVIELGLKDRLASGMLYVPQNFLILHPKHLSMEANIEMQSLELRQLEVLKAISPQRYRKTMLLLLQGISGAANANNLKADIDALTQKLGDVEDAEAIEPQALARIQSIELDIMMREIEILCSMPKGHMRAMAQKPGIGDVIKQIHGFISDLIREANGESDEAPAKKQPRSRKAKESLETIAKAS